MGKPVALGLCAVATLAAALPFATHAPNRLISGVPVPVTGAPGAVWLAVALAGVLGCAVARAPAWADAVAAAVALAVVLLVAGWTASGFAQGDKPAARTDLGGGGWLMAGAALLALSDAARRAGRPRAAGLGAAGLLGVLVASGALDDLGLLREYAVRRGAFWAAVGGHAALVAAAAIPALLLGLPLGYAGRSRPWVLGALGAVQTIPSLALFGLLLPVLGVGFRPAALALALYALLPVAGATAAGFAQVPDAVRDAARGVGFSAREVFWRVDVPLAWPVVRSGLRVMLVQATGLAVVAALVGAGGLGSLVFEGVFANALDLVLLGTLPVVAMALAADAALAGG